MEPRPPGRGPERLPFWDRAGRVERRRQRIREEIERNRRGDYKIPTWVLALILVAMVAAWAAVAIFA